jgi:hypothetical protein
VPNFINDGKITQAINQLDAFIGKVEHDITKGNISEEDGNMLINMAHELINVLLGQ